MTLDEFADKYRVKVKRDACNDPIIPGKWGHVWASEVAAAGFGVCLMYETKRKYTAAKKQAVAAGFEWCQDGDTEGTAMFAANNWPQARLALKLAGVKKRRIMAPEQAEAAKARLQAHQFRTRKGTSEA